eukprot:5629842-Prymnesium_polylepis.1
MVVHRASVPCSGSSVPVPLLNRFTTTSKSMMRERERSTLLYSAPVGVVVTLTMTKLEDQVLQNGDTTSFHISRVRTSCQTRHRRAR